MLIQSVWKCYAADKNFSSKATWRIHMREPVQSTTNAWREVAKKASVLRRRKSRLKMDVGNEERRESGEQQQQPLQDEVIYEDESQKGILFS